MKLFYSPGACSMAVHIVLNELEMAFTAEKVDIPSHKWSGGDYYKVNPKGYVPCIQTDTNQTLTEGVVIMQYLADQKPEKHLVPKFGTFERYQMMETLNYLSTEVHKSFHTWFAAERLVPADGVATFREKAKESILKKFDYLNNLVKPGQFTCGTQFTIADAYLFTMLAWSKKLNFDMKKYPNLLGVAERIATRPGVQKTLKTEGLM
jgi:glutathione S-transferase